MKISVPKMAPEFRDAQNGFTLVEMLVALFLLSLITLLISEAFRGAGRVTEQAEQISTQSELRQLRNYLSGAVGGAIPRQITGDKGQIQSVFLGAPNELKFVTSHTVSGQFAGLYVTRLHLVPAASRSNLYDLWLDQHLFHRFARTDRRVSPRVKLLEDIANIRFSYHGLVKGNIYPSWSDHWENATTAPSLLSVDIDFAPDDKRYWPTMHLRLRAN